MRDCKRGVREAWALVLGVVLLAGLASESAAQGASDRVSAAVQQMQSASGAGVRATRSRLTGLATFVASKGAGVPVQDRGTALGRAEAFVDAYGGAFGLRDSQQVREVRSPGRDALGVDHVRLQQVVGDVPVVGGELMVHLRGTRVMAANGRALPDLEGFDTRATLSPAEAERAARGLCEKKLGASDVVLSEARLEILNKGVLEGQRQPTQLAWFVEATGPELREYIWVDARRGGIALHFSQLHKARNRQIYTANSTYTIPGSLLAAEGFAPVGDADALAAYNFSGDTYDYYLSEHGRDSYDGLGGALVSTVHYCPGATSCPYKNAYWDGVQMVYGEGYSKADDVDAHELTHAVTERTAGLYYYMQSGALNESFSDMFGETVDLWNTDRGDATRRGTDTAAVRWLMGEDVPGLGAIRNMMNPNQFGDPGKTSDTQYLCGDVSNDRGGVHRNSGVPNHAFALMVDGGTYNGITVSGIGLRKAAQIQYRVLTQYLTTASDFAEYYDAVGQACGDLVGGAAGIMASDCQQARLALDAVQIAAPALCNQAIVPDLCPAGKVPSNLFFDDFESGSAKWTLTQTAGYSGDAWALETGYATSGTHLLYAPDPTRPYYYGFTSSDVQASMVSSVPIPSGDVRLQFNHAFDIEYYYDGGVVEYSTDGGATWLDTTSFFTYGRGILPNYSVYSSGSPLYGRTVFARPSSGYTASQLNLSSLAGQNVRLRFRLGADSSVGYWGWAIDDVRLYQCVDAGLPSLRISDATVREGDTGWRYARFTVALSAPSSSVVTVQYATGDVTATAGADYTAASGTLAIPAGALVGEVSTSVAGDTTVEGDESFLVTLSNPVGASIVDGTGIGAILENDGVPLPPTTSAWALARQGMSTQNGVAFGAGRYVSVGNAGNIWVSSDGASWSARPVPAGPNEWDPDLRAITYGGGQFVAVGGCCSSLFTSEILTSSDGITWTEQNAGGVTSTLNAVTFGSGLYVAVGSSGRILTSPDGVTWTQRVSGTTQALWGVAYGGTAFVAVGSAGTVLRSPDGVTWTPQTSTTTSTLYSVTNTGTQFVAVTYGYSVFTSPDGITWTARALPAYGSLRGVTSGPGGIVAVGSSYVYTSSDGITWTQRALPAVGPGQSRYVYAVGYGGSGLVAVGSAGAVFASPDGATWVSRQLAASRYLSDVAYDGTRFCAVGSDGAFLSSSDGVTWMQAGSVPTSSPGYYYSASQITRGPSLFVAAGSRILTSPDCLTWTYRPTSVPVTTYSTGHGFYDVAYGAGRYVAVGYRYLNSQTAMIQVSVDGVQWTDVQLPGLGLESAYVRSVGYVGGRFLASGYSNVDGTPLFLTSSDGLSWSKAPTPPLGTYRALEDFAELSGRIVATDGLQPWVSTDGVNWSPFEWGGLSSYGFWSFAAGDSRFLGVGAGAFESLDGISWTPQDMPARAYLNGASYSESLNRFVVVGDGVIEYTNDSLQSLSVGDVAVVEDAGPARFTVTLSEPAGHAVSVQYQTVSGTAAAPGDYGTVTGTLTFAPGETTKTFDVPVVADGVAEGDETFGVTLTLPTNAALGDAMGVGTIQDSSSSPTFSIGDVTVTEGTGGSTLATFTVSLSGGTNAATVRYATANGTAVAGEDYVAQTGTLTFASGETTKTVSVVVTGDALDESDETFTVSLSSPSNAHVGDGVGIGTIVDDDTGGLAELVASSVSVAEGGVATLQVKRTGSVAAGETVVYTTSNGTATAGADYTAKTGTLTFAAGVKVLSFTVPSTPDTLVEGPETFAVTLSSPGGGASVGPVSTAVVTVKDDDLGGSLKLSAAAYTVTESGPLVTVTVMRTGGVASGVSVDYATSDATAAAGSDYTATSGTLTFGAGVAVRTFTVAILNDALAEGSEGFSVSLSNPRGGATLASPSSSAVTITDNEPMVQFSLAGYTVTEVGSAATITVVRTGGTAAFTVDYVTANGSALSGLDYTGVSGTLSFAAGVMLKTFTVPILDDTLGEGDETVFLSLVNPAGAYLGPRGTSVLTIKDNEPVVQLSATSYTVSEAAASAVITVVRTGGTGAFSVYYAASTGSAVSGVDFAATSGLLTFPAGVMSKTITVPLVNDTLAESTEYFWVQLYSPTSALVGPKWYGQVNITDNDGSVFRMSAAASTVSEAAGTATVTIVRSGSTAPASVSYYTSGGSAYSGSDFTYTSGTLSFAAGVMSQTVTVPVALDALAEANEYFYVVLNYATGGTVGTPYYTTVTITEASPVVQFSSATYTAAEAAGLATVTVTRTGATTVPVTVTYATSGGTATAGSDYTAVTGSLNFAAGTVAKTFTVPITNDGVPDSGEVLGLTLSNPVGGAIGPRGTATLTITDTQPVVQFSAATYTVLETGPAATITVVRTGTTPVTVSYATLDGTALAGSDYTASSGALSFPAGVLTKTFTVPITNDTDGEPAETLTLNLSSPTGAALGPRASAVLTITDNEPVVQLSAVTYSASEAGPVATITVVRTGTAAFTVQYATSDGTATAGSDYQTSAGVLSFPVGAMAKTFTVPIVNDTLDEANETVFVALSGPVGASVGARATATLTIVDNDTAGTIAFSAPVFTIGEAGPSALVTVTRAGGVSSGASVDFATSDGTALAGSDYTAVSGTLIFAAGEVAKTIAVPIANDGASEPTETVLLTLSAPAGGALLGAQKTATLVVVDNE